ncbi:hypothetical protein BX616_010378, partial [Lobosporangium transversale]
MNTLAFRAALRSTARVTRSANTVITPVTRALPSLRQTARTYASAPAHHPVAQHASDAPWV